MPGSRYHPGLRSRLVTVAVDLLGEAGADALSLRAVARRAGVSAMAPYRHYPGKAALLAAVAAHGFATLHQVLQAADAGAPPGGALVEQAVAYVRFATGHPALFRLMFSPMEHASHPDLAAASAAAYAVLQGRVAQDAPGANQDARTLGCWSLVHGLACLVLDGKLAADGVTPSDDLTRRVAQAMLP